ncbi:MAG: hypothetical protein M3Y20_04205 [Actinomycetota bacterium]|nr:hypothetical protein [Actinomycetota bacterium]
MKWLTPRRRRYIYRVTTAALVVAGFYGILGPEEVTAWTAFLAVALVTGLADANTDPAAR